MITEKRSHVSSYPPVTHTGHTEPPSDSCQTETAATEDKVGNYTTIRSSPVAGTIGRRFEKHRCCLLKLASELHSSAFVLDLIENSILHDKQRRLFPVQKEIVPLWKLSFLLFVRRYQVSKELTDDRLLTTLTSPTTSASASTTNRNPNPTSLLYFQIENNRNLLTFLNPPVSKQ